MLLTISLIVLFASTPVMFAALLFLPAPYGRYPTEGWGPSIGARAGWIVMELPALAVIFLVVFFSGGRPSAAALALLLAWELHYVYRTLLFPFLIREKGKRFPILLIVIAVLFNVFNGYANGVSLASVPPPLAEWRSGTRFAVGLGLFVSGFCIHVWADGTLRGLRAPGETGYKIPRGGLFERITSPNYFGEVLEWFGWAIAAWSYAGLAFALFTAANLVPRAHAHRNWYLAHFPDFPRERKRIIPFLF
jgi:protein-S-isoprenylcysteine O-methyltransferase Ste14